jgi:hypothetical protein
VAIVRLLALTSGLAATLGAPGVAATALLLLIVSSPPSPQPESGGPQPLVRIPKSTYAAGEAVFFWVGVESQEPLTQETYKPCRIELVGPHEPARVTFLEWPMDGDPRHGWQGGDGLAPEKSLPGNYSVRVTCGGKTVAGTFQVAPVSIVRELEARFACRRGCGGDPADTTISLTVANHSDQDVVVSRPGAIMGYGVGFQAKWHDPPGSCDAAFPDEALGLKPPSVGDVIVETMTREDLPHVPHFDLGLGESRVQSFCLASGRPSCQGFTWPPTTVRVSTTLQVLVGAPGGPFSHLGALRLAVSGVCEPR